jgi:signal transduction histidine kinase
MGLFAASGLINGLIAISFGILVIAKNWRERANQLFFLMTISLAIWSLSYWQWLSANEYNAALFWVRILSLGSLFIPVFFFHWVITFLKRDGVHKIIALFLYLAAIAISATASTQFFIAGLEKKSFFNFWPNSGLAYDIYFSYIYVGLIIYSIFVLVYSYYTNKEEKKRGQILFIIIGALLGFGGGLTNFPLWWGINIPPYGNFLVAAFPFLLGYSIIKYRLFNVKTIATELLVFFIAITLVTQTILAETIVQFILRGTFALAFSILGYLMIRSIYREVEQREKIEQLAGQLENFIHFLSHEVKGILGKNKAMFGSMLEGDFGGISPQLEPMIRQSLKDTDSSVNMVMNVLQSSDIKNGKLVMNKEKFDFRAVVKEAIEKIKPDIEKKGLALETQLDEQGDYIVCGDKKKIGEHVIRNLLNNALVYTTSGKITVGLARQEDRVRFFVKDTGLGLSENTKAKLFTEGGKGEESSKVNVHSTGYGLFFAKGIVDAHGGRIWAKSEGVGKGSTFYVELKAV